MTGPATKSNVKPLAVAPYQITAPLPREYLGWVAGPEFGPEAQSCAIIGVCCYPGNQLAFWIRGSGRWLYSYVPAHYLMLKLDGLAAARPARTMRVPAASKGFAIDAPIESVISLGGAKYDALAMVDFLDCNELFWILARQSDGVIVVSTHRYFDSSPPPCGLQKMRQTWT